MTNISPIPVLKDNYAWLLAADNEDIAVIDPGEAEPVITALNNRDLRLTHIFLTHHHHDHVGGVEKLRQHYDVTVIGPAAEQDRLPPLDTGVSETDRPYAGFGNIEITILDTPGHTSGAVTYYLPEIKAVFTGDTLFSMGCGRLFEGTPQQMWDSLQKIAALPEDTKVYCGHEYTLGGAEFCLTVEPDNQELLARYKAVQSFRDQGRPSLPSTIGLEKKTNAFLRAGTADEFARIRQQKDAF